MIRLRFVYLARETYRKKEKKKKNRTGSQGPCTAFRVLILIANIEVNVCGWRFPFLTVEMCGRWTGAAASGGGSLDCLLDSSPSAPGSYQKLARVLLCA